MLSNANSSLLFSLSLSSSRGDGKIPNSLIAYTTTSWCPTKTCIKALMWWTIDCFCHSINIEGLSNMICIPKSKYSISCFNVAKYPDCFGYICVFFISTEETNARCSYVVTCTSCHFIYIFADNCGVCRQNKVKLYLSIYQQSWLLPDWWP